MTDNTLRKAKSAAATAWDAPAPSRAAIGAHMPESLADRFMLCPVCREEYDMRDLGEVLQHLHASPDESDSD
jgi:hypothetical protein